MDAASDVVVNFCGERHSVDASRPFVIGRTGDLVIDEDNRHLHRRFIEISHEHNLWWIANVGQTLSATLSSRSARLQAWLGPGVRIPLVFSSTEVRFTAGPTTYELEIDLQSAAFAGSPAITEEDDGVTRTIGRVELVPEQKLLVIALAEPALRNGRSSILRLPSNSEAAQRLNWTIVKFNRKLDAVCLKLKKSGVRGLHGGTDRLASDRRARLVEYALAVGLVTEADLHLLDSPSQPCDGGVDD